MSSQVSNSEFSSGKKNVELLNISDLQLDTSFEGTLQASPISMDDIEKKLEALDEDLNFKLLSNEAEEGNYPSYFWLLFYNF